MYDRKRYIYGYKSSFNLIVKKKSQFQQCINDFFSVCI